MIHAKLTDIDSPDIEGDWETFRPNDPEVFVVTLWLEVGVEEDPIGSDLFTINVCSPAWIQQLVKTQQWPLYGRGYMIVNEFRFTEIERQLPILVSNCRGETWEDVADLFDNFACWEYGMNGRQGDPPG